jgi:hypothetical protein
VSDRLAIFTILVRVPEDATLGWSVRSVETKQEYFDDIVEYGVIEIHNSDTKGDEL